MNCALLCSKMERREQSPQIKTIRRKITFTLFCEHYISLFNIEYHICKVDSAWIMCVGNVSISFILHFLDI